VADGWCWFVVREKYRWLVAGGWFVLREKYCWLVADKPSEQGVNALCPPWEIIGGYGNNTYSTNINQLPYCILTPSGLEEEGQHMITKTQL
jgi:hypothetical protein